MLFESSKQTGRIPLLLIVGTCELSTSALINTLLKHTALANTVVFSSARNGRAQLNGTRVIELPVLESSAQEACLCCGMHSALGDALRKLFFEALTFRGKGLDRVMIESTSINTAQLAFTLRHTPFLGQRYFHQLTFRVMTETELLLKGLEILKGLDTSNDQTQQFLIIAPPPHHSGSVVEKNEVHGQSASQSQFDAWKTDIERTLPYRQVLRLGHDSLHKSLGLC